MVALAIAEPITYPAVGASLGVEHVSHAFDIDGSALPVLDDDGRAIRWLGTNTDIHDRKLVEAELKIAKTAAEKFIDKGAEMLSEDIKRAPRMMSGDPKQLKAYLDSAEDTRSLLKGLGKVVQYGSYSAKAMDAINAETDTKRREALGDLAGC